MIYVVICCDEMLCCAMLCYVISVLISCLIMSFHMTDYSTSICHYNAAILCQPTPFAPLYSNRAAAYLKRGFPGDAFCALRDADMAIHADETFAKAYYRKIQALQVSGGCMWTCHVMRGIHVMSCRLYHFMSCDPIASLMPCM